MIKKHSAFIRGILVGVSMVAVLDIPIVHWLIGAHRAYDHPSVDIFEPTIVMLAVFILIYNFYLEYK